ncbi:GNAT family N-acetyltransferase [Aquimarina agarivorans]|uniref:GNAT family N-acetyltransferase n=1 Tax=Aquimarina agarivorans TaxID=980584 RepID=UPI000248E980|nr:GNAT family N-acetyltransferase [Aquimarina agarivorans]
MNYIIKKYQSTDYNIWNSFISKAKNSTFLFHRDFMDYHSDRFYDHSLMVYSKNNLVAVLPANEKNRVLYSHQGLTYGGLLLLKSMGVIKIEAIFLAIVHYLKNKKFKAFELKSLPLFYHKIPSFELEPLLHKLGAQLTRREQNLAIDYSTSVKIHKTKLKHYKKNLNLGFKIQETTSFHLFWGQILEPRLAEKHKTKPVHSIHEITLLKKKFPENIVQYNIYLYDEILAGITIFKTNNVVKSQYGATSKNGEKYRALDFLFIHLIEKFKEEGYRYFDMGTVVGNMSLLKQKEELGCNQYLQDYYCLELH